MYNSKERIMKQLRNLIILFFTAVISILILFFFNLINDNKNKDEDLSSVSVLNKDDKFFTSINQIKSSNGIEVELHEASADDNILVLIFYVRNNDQEIEDIFDAAIDITSLKVNDINTNSRFIDKFEREDDNEVKITRKIELLNKNAEDNINVSLEIRSMFGKIGDWNMEFSLDIENGKKNIYSEDLNKIINLESTDIEIRNIEISPLSVVITCSATDNFDETMEFLVFNQDDEQVRFFLKRNTVKDGINEVDFIYTSDTYIKKLSITPIINRKNVIEHSLESTKINLDEFHQFYLRVDEYTFIKIEDCILDEDKLIVKYNYEYDGNDADMKFTDLFIIDDGQRKFDISSNISSDLKKKYFNEEYQTAIFRISDDINRLELGCYDGKSKQFLKEENIFIENQNASR